MSREIPVPSIFLLVLIGFALIGCSRENKFYPNPNDPRQAFGIGAEGPPGPDGEDGRDFLPSGLFDHSVNQAEVDVALDGSTATSVALRLRTDPVATNSAGSFNGSDIGNKAILGFSSYDNLSLGDFLSFAFESKVFAGSQSLYVNLVLDLYCDGSTLKIAVADSTTLGSGTTLSNGYTGWEAGANESKWKALGGLQDPVTPAITILPSHLGSTGGKLSDVYAAYPFACLANAATGDGGMPSGAATSAVMLLLGDSMTTAFNAAFVRKVNINSDTYSEF